MSRPQFHLGFTGRMAGVGADALEWGWTQLSKVLHIGLAWEAQWPALVPLTCLPSGKQAAGFNPWTGFNSAPEKAGGRGRRLEKRVQLTEGFIICC